MKRNESYKNVALNLDSPADSVSQLPVPAQLKPSDIYSRAGI